MATDYRSKASRGAFGGILSGLNEGFDADNKNRFARDEKREQRRWEAAKMMAQNQFTRETDMMKYQREQSPGQPMGGEQDAWLTPKQLLEQNEKNRKISTSGEGNPTKDELVAFKTGQLADSEGLSEDQVAAIIEEMAKNRGYTQSEEVEEETGKKTGGLFNWGIGPGAKPEKRKFKTYSKNQFQR